MRSFAEITVTGSGQWQPKALVVMQETALGARCVARAHLIGRVGIVFEHLVTMRKPLWHIERAHAIGIELDSDMLEIGWSSPVANRR